MADERLQVFAVVRLDDTDSEVSREDLHELITVKEIVPTQAEAAAEVERLNALLGGTHYFWQATRFYPNGRSSTASQRDHSVE
jgi:hypothetical protein